MAKNQTIKINWWVDVILFVGFILAFLLEVTGLSLHQWGGLFICLLAGYHLLRHWKWITAMLPRFFKSGLSSQRLRFFVDLFLMLGFEIILLTGLMISTWFALSLTDYLLVRNFHVLASIASLGLLVLKVSLHARWIISSMRKIFQKPAPRQASMPGSNTLPPTTKNMERREVLRLMGTVGAASLTALLVGGSTTFRSIFRDVDAPQNESGADPSLPPNPTATSSPTPTMQSVTPTSLPNPQTPSQRRNRGQNQTTITPTSTATLSQNSPTIPAVTPTPTSPTTTCIVRCPKGCAYPGSCRRYVDANFNNLCDLGECL